MFFGRGGGALYRRKSFRNTLFLFYEYIYYHNNNCKYSVLIRLLEHHRNNIHYTYIYLQVNVQH